MTDSTAHAQHARAVRDATRRTPSAPPEEAHLVRRHAPAPGLVFGPAPVLTIRRAPFDKGWLSSHEVGKAHTLDRHVGKSDAELVARVNAEKITAASSFGTQDDAEALVAATIQANQTAVDAWLKGGGAKLAVDHSFPRTSGRSVDKKKGGQAVVGDVHDVTRVRVVLIKSTLSGLPGYQVLTAFPR